MSSPRPTVFKLLGLLAFLATLATGWQLAAPTASRAPTGKSAGPTTKRADRPARAPRFAPAESAGKRMGSIRTTADPEARMLATLALVNSLSPAEFAAWKEGGWFDLRGGPELLVFSRILMERWKQEDPEGLLAWATKKRNGEADGLIDEWAAKEPLRLIAYFKTHRDDKRELLMLAKIAANSPEIAIQRLREMIGTDLAANALGQSSELMGVLAAKSPAELAAVLDSLPTPLKFEGESAMSKLRLEASFSDELHSLRERPDGWKILSNYLDSSDEFGSKLLSELADLPLEWREGIAMNPWRVVKSSNAQQWLDADLESAGFSAENCKWIRLKALEQLAQTNPAEVIRHMAHLETYPDRRENLLSRLFGSDNDPEKMRALISLLPTDEDRQTATRFLDQRTASKEVTNVHTAGELLAKLGSLDPHLGNAHGYFSQARNWDQEKIASLATDFKVLPDVEKLPIARVIVTQLEYNGAPSALRDEAIRYVMENPPEEDLAVDSWKTVSGKISQYAVNFSEKDPAAAADWMQSLPAGEIKLWAQKNLAKNWVQYDPPAVEQWMATLPPDVRGEVGDFMKKRD